MSNLSAAELDSFRQIKNPRRAASEEQFGENEFAFLYFIFVKILRRNVMRPREISGETEQIADKSKRKTEGAK